MFSCEMGGLGAGTRGERVQKAVGNFTHRSLLAIVNTQNRPLCSNALFCQDTEPSPCVPPCVLILPQHQVVFPNALNKEFLHV